MMDIHSLTQATHGERDTSVFSLLPLKEEETKEE